MPIYCEVKKNNSSNSNGNNKEKQILIIVPKKFIKRAVDRNKLRRRIKTILHQYKINSCVVKYFYNEVKTYQEIKTIIEECIRVV